MGEVTGTLETHVSFPTVAGLAAISQIPDSSAILIPQQCSGWQGQDPGRSLCFICHELNWN